METAPLQQDAIALAGVLLQALERADPAAQRYHLLRERLVGAALTTLEEVVIALRLPEPTPHLLLADDALAVLRVHLSIAEALGLLPPELFLSSLDQADRMGRQIGGLLRSLGPAARERSPEPRRPPPQRPPGSRPTREPAANRQRSRA